MCLLTVRGRDVYGHCLACRIYPLWEATSSAWPVMLYFNSPTFLCTLDFPGATRYEWLHKQDNTRDHSLTDCKFICTCSSCSTWLERLIFVCLVFALFSLFNKICYIFTFLSMPSKNGPLEFHRAMAGPSGKENMILWFLFSIRSLHHCHGWGTSIGQALFASPP